MGMIKKVMALVSLLILLTSILSCVGDKLDDKQVFSSIQEVPESAWRKLATKHIFFAHQSVGFNIIDGIKDLTAENHQIKINIVESADTKDWAAPVLAHSKVGKNADPNSKFTEFIQFMEAGLGARTDVAFLKLCYIDVTSNTDVDALFSAYKDLVSYLKKRFPATTFVHVTVPLTTLQTGIKAWIKQVIGRSVDGYDDNIRREQINEKIRKEYGGKEPVFDLALIESTRPDGSRASFKHEDGLYYSLAPEYTYDGGHLNETGRKIAAEKLLVLLSNLTD
jgi:hypothetical protein